MDSLISEDILRSKHRSYSNLHDYPTQDTLRLSQEHHIPQYHAEQPMIYDYDNYKKLQYQFSITEGEKVNLIMRLQVLVSLWVSKERKRTMLEERKSILKAFLTFRTKSSS